MAEADQKTSTLNLDFPLPLLRAVKCTTSQGFDLAAVWEAFEQALIWDRIHAWDPRRAHFEAMAPFLPEFSQAGTPPADTDVIGDRGHIRGSTWRQWLADGSLDRETGTIARLFEGRRPHVEVFEPVLEGTDVRSVYLVLSAQRAAHAKQPAAATVADQPNSPPEPGTSDHYAAKPFATARWIAAETRNMKVAGEISDRIRITDLSKKLEERMRTAAETDKSMRPVKWGHIKNHLREWGCWPLSSINS